MADTPPNPAPDRSIMPTALSPAIPPIFLLIASNVFMTVVWYGHLKSKSVALPLVILASWSIAFIEYCLAVPANRIGQTGLFRR